MAKPPKAKPETEIILESLQTKFLETRDPEIWKEMFEIMVQYARSLTLKQSRGKVFLDPDHVLGVATDATIKVMERYNQPDFLISHSFAGLLRWKVIESLYSGWKEEANTSINLVFPESSSNKVELGDLQEKLHITPLTPSLALSEEAENNEDLVLQTLKNVITEYDAAVGSYRLSLLARAYLLLWLRKSKVRNAPISFKKYLKLSPREEEALDLLLLEIRNRLSLTS